MTRVAYVCADPGIPVFGTKGASVHLQELVRVWRARGADVEVYAVRRGDPGQVPADLADLTVHEVPVPGHAGTASDREAAQRRAADEIARRLVRAAPDVVHERYSLFSTVLAALRRERGRELTAVLEVNAPLVDEQRTHRELVDEPGALAALAAQVAAADVVACVSEPVAAWVRARTGDGDGDGDAAVVVTPNGVNTDRIRPVTADRSGDPVVVFVGTLKLWHGVDHLVAAAAEARRPWRLRIVGDGPQRAAVEAEAARRGVAVEFTGALPPQEVPAALRGAMVAVAPYPETEDHYFSPLKVYEYSAAALPVVASRIGQIPAIVEHGHTGLLVPPSDPRSLAAAVDTLVGDPDRAAAMGAAGRALVTARHTWHHVLATTLAGVRDGIPEVVR